MKQRPHFPLATYRLQLNRDFTFAQATAIVPYLSELGISHFYVSPLLKARAGSMHGYDIVDHNQLNPEIGTMEEFDQFVDTLHQHGMGQILELVRIRPEIVQLIGVSGRMHELEAAAGLTTN